MEQKSDKFHKNLASLIVTFNPSNSDYNSISSCLGQVGDIIVLDNSTNSLSRNNLIEFVKTIQSSTKVHIVLNEKNLGLSKSYNEGIRIARSLGSQFLILMDQDSYFLKDSIVELYYAYEEMKSLGFVGVISPTIVLKKGNIESIFSRIGDKISFAMHKKFENNSIIQSNFTINSGTFLPISIINEDRFYDEELFTDGIDILFCYKLKSRELGIFRSKRSYLIHNENASFFKIGGLTLPIFLYNSKRLYHIIHDYLTLFKKTYISHPFSGLRHLLDLVISLMINFFFGQDRRQIMQTVCRATDEWINNR